MQYILGLDIGICSVGWSVLRCHSDGEPYKIENLGVRMFEKAEHPKTGASLAVARREARGRRRNIRRRRHRKERIKHLIFQNNIMTQAELQQLFVNSGYEKDVYTLRSEGLDRMLDRGEWVRVLIHLSQRRGYRSISTAESAKANESGAIKTALSENTQLMAQKGYRTVGEMFCNDEKFKVISQDGTVWRKTRNSNGEYHFSITRELAEQEVQTLFSAQRAHGNPFASKEFEEQYRSILFSQRSFDEGPGGDSPYQKIDLRGECRFEPQEPRAFKACYTFEYFKLLQDINHIRLLSSGEPARQLNKDERECIIALAMKSDGLHYGRLRKALKLPADTRFNTVHYWDEEDEVSEKKAKFSQMQFYHKMRKVLDSIQKGLITTFSHDQLDEIGTILSLYKADERRRTKLKELGLDDIVINRLLPLSFNKVTVLSLTAIRKLIPHLEEGRAYNAACSLVYGNSYEDQVMERSHLLSFQSLREQGTLDAITSPVVLRAVSQSFKVINAIIRKYGSPVSIHLQLGHEVSLNFAERKKLDKKNQENRSVNEQLMAQIEKLKGSHPTGQDLVKFKLFLEQNETCLYSGQKLDKQRLFDPDYVKVNYIIPYSISFDDSYNNKVLALTSECEQKGAFLPLEYMANDLAKQDRFTALVKSTIRNSRKRKLLLKTEFTEEDWRTFRNRKYSDTQYMTRTVYTVLKDYLEFAPSDCKQKVIAINGNIRDYMRKRFGLQKSYEHSDLRHAIDAVVLSVTSEHMLQRISNYAKRRESEKKVMGQYVDPETGELMAQEDFDDKYAPTFPEPWPLFRYELEVRLSPDPMSKLAALNLPTYHTAEEIHPVFVSRMPKHKVTGSAHEATIHSAKKAGCFVMKTDLSALQLDKDREIKDYYDPNSDRLLYEALKERLVQFGGNGQKAFVEPFYKPKRDGSPGPLVRKVKTYSKTNLCVPTRGGIARNGDMIRIDVFYVENDGYYLVPIYASDVVKDTLPQLAPVAAPTRTQWKTMSDDDFIFSLYPGDLIYIESNRKIRLSACSSQSVDAPTLMQDKLLVYYCGTNIASGAISVKTHDGMYMKQGTGIKTLRSIRKFQVDVLGTYHEVHIPEVRRKFR